MNPRQWEAVYDDDAKTVTVQGVQGVHAQCAGIEEAEHKARKALADVYGLAPESYRVKVANTRAKRGRAK